MVIGVDAGHLEFGHLDVDHAEIESAERRARSASQPGIMGQ
jgi:hypothetical protein